MSSATAWLMQIDRMSRIAVGKLELIHIIATPDFIQVPKAPDYCNKIVLWNNKIIPVIDISMLTNKTSSFTRKNSVAVAIYEDPVTNELKYGGVQLSDMPVMENVTNDQAALKDQLKSIWWPISVSCFKSEDDEIIPVLDVSKVFSKGIDNVVHQS